MDVCGAVDEITSAVCTKTAGHAAPHSDESDWGCIVTFPTEGAKLWTPDEVEEGAWAYAAGMYAAMMGVAPG